ncbi:hypothetical protein B9Q13_00490 [Candidatus Marsarchaeota G2 archaeon ECH_B_SAG-G16]|uniref:ribose-phosphate diphosphokinase n=1 Tax=Candidatus Marsarchaeota G2 archaeon ECH_B_SAG-G16 TaxID=1978167 RepID=A0A2R6C4Q0_9ARCH|nr:MAG: hypothetical protein B9Q13_00490 [Candidatus Marsarchaeota G2 archaeon ECH_B_SAG-G16]
MNDLVVYGPSSRWLASELAQELECDTMMFQTKIFPDGETYVRLPASPSSKDVILLNTFYPNQDRRIVETLLMCDALRRSGVQNITLIVPYLAYARQDKVFLSGEPISLVPIGRALSCLGVNDVIVVEAHSKEALEALGLNVTNVEVRESMLKALEALKIKPDVIVAPDKKAEIRASWLALKLNAELLVFEKSRDRLTGQVSSQPVKEVNVSQKSVLIVDDIISTGGSVANASSFLKKEGALEIRAMCVHALMVGDAESVLFESGVLAVYGSNTIETKFSKYSVVGELSRALKR